MFEEKVNPLSPINFFQISADCFPLSDKPFPVLNAANAKKYRLPDTSALTAEYHFADISMGWCEAGIEIFAHIQQEFHRSSYPDPSQGDSLEVFIDTRDVKTSGFNTRFCHHFFFLPEPIEGVQSGEITRFRTEDAHELCDSSKLIVKSTLKKSGYILQIFIPTQCLHGYDVDQFDRLGFTYRVNRSQGSQQHFSVTTDDYQLEQQPSLWSSLKLVK